MRFKSLGAALAAARRIANRTGHPVTVTPVTLANPWITTSNKRRVHIGDDGRIDRGLPAVFRGVHIRDVAPLSRTLRELAATPCAPRRRYYTTRQQAAKAIEDTNAGLVDFLEETTGESTGTGLEDYRRKVRRRRPFRDWREAMREAIPGGRRSWGDLWAAPSFQRWIEAVTSSYGWRGGEVNPPRQTIEAMADQDLADMCRRGVEGAQGEAVDRARSGRIEAEEAPF